MIGQKDSGGQNVSANGIPEDRAVQKASEMMIEDSDPENTGIDLADSSPEGQVDNGADFEANLQKRHMRLHRQVTELTKRHQRLNSNLNEFVSVERIKKNQLEKRLKFLEEQLRFNRLQAQDRDSLKTDEARRKADTSLLGKIILPFSLAGAWLKNRHPRSLGDKNYSRVIEAWKNGGMKAAEDLVASCGASSFVKGNAYTALARYLREEKKTADMLQASELAYKVNPRDFRIKWHAFRLGEAGYYTDAEALLALLDENVHLTESELSRRRNIIESAEIERNAIMEIGYAPTFQSRSEALPENRFRVNRDRFDEGFMEICRLQGPGACIKNLDVFLKHNKSLMSSALVRIARGIREEFPDYEYPLVKKALELKKNLSTIRTFFWTAQRNRKYLEAASVIDLFASKLNLLSSGSMVDTYRSMKSSMTANLQLLKLVIHNNIAAYQDFTKSRICYVLHNSLPFSSGGYATRANGIARGLKKAGYDVQIITRPGYPADIVPELEDADLPEIWEDDAGISYHRILRPFRKDYSLKEYLELSADKMEEKFRELNPELVIAASNHITALPALIAARRLGIPFFYEVRGLWEITRISREEKFKESNAFYIQRIFETEICKKAERVFTLTEGLKGELAERGVSAERIVIAPNACNPEQFTPMAKDRELMEHLNIPEGVPVIGYVGTFVIYEGLDDLAQACGLLKDRGKEFRLLLVGNENASGSGKGEITERIEQIAAEKGFSDWLILPGRIPHEEVRKYYSLIDIAPFPRRPWPVCEIVSPMKPMEAMSMEKAVLMSSVGALREMARHMETAVFFEKGNLEDLAFMLEKLIDQPETRKIIGRNARAHIIANRTWDRSGSIIAQSLEEVLKEYAERKEKTALEEQIMSGNDLPLNTES